MSRIVALGLLVALISTRPSLADDADKLFTLKVYPLLKDKCLGCHGGDEAKIKGDFDVRTRASLVRGGKSKTAGIVPGQPGDSLIVRAIRWDGLEMPPKENDRLTPRQIEWVEKWISAGAPWPDAATRRRIQVEERSVVETADGILISTSGGLADEWTYRRYVKGDVWAFRPVARPEPPPGNGHPVDAFIDARLKTAGLAAAPEADARTLLRRASYDLIGLPPTPKERAEFLAAWQVDADKAWTALIDRLMASPHYGERWGQHWLDVVRYADTSGFSNDYERSNAWRYRDYVVRSFNEDKPYDEFVVEQIAGDELRPDDPEAIVATGFLRMGPWGTAMVMQDEARQLFVDDIVHSVGQSFLSIPMRCAKCHDHKFDPIPTRDYYRMYAAFSATHPAEVPAAFLAEENLRGKDGGKDLVDKLHKLADDDRRRIVKKREDAARSWYAEHELPYKDLKARRDDPDDMKPPRHVGLDYVDEGTLKVREQDSWIWNRRRERYQPMAQSVYNGQPTYLNARKLRRPKNIDSKWRPASFIYSGGDRNAKGQAVTPGVLSGCGVATSNAQDPYGVTIDVDGRRLALAKWIARDDHPLTARSIVNRIWQHHFGGGIVATPNNFGVKGSKPTHEELLDWLTAEFVAGGWRMKRLHRLIMTSQAYRRSASPSAPEKLDTVDPTNSLLSHFRPRMLSAEEYRDSALAVSGELNREVGGLPVMPEINREVAFEPRMIQFSIAPARQPSRTPAERNRRSIYAYRVRGQADPFLEVLHRPTPNDSCEARESTAVTPQALTLLNSEAMGDRSIAMALRLQKEHPDDLEAQIRRGTELALGRPPTAEELRRWQSYVRDAQAYHEQHEPRPQPFPTQIDRSLVEEFSGKPFNYVEWLPVFEDYVPHAKPWTASAATRALADLCLIFFNANEFVYVY